ncbi:hypothetical protein HDU81_010460 [Chytriomyces hyalinus]|nr:hypothetical protein HDU81_010460 [Chytriomyces hyalinus]
MYLILGAGISGVCTAFYLSQLAPDSEIVIVDSEGCVAGCASGKAGGFLARDWPRSQLSRKSFDLHAELASSLDGPTKWLYRRVDTYSASLAADKSEKSRSDTLDWINAAAKPSQIGSTANTTQVHPHLFCEALFARSQATLVHASVCDLVASDGVVTGVSVRDNDGQMRTIKASHVVVALGPWCDRFVREKWGIPIREVEGQIGHSIVFQSDSQRPIPAHCLFTEMNKMEGPEVYPRSDGSIYMCGGGSCLGDDDESSSEDLLPASPALVKPSERAISKLMQLSDSLFGPNRNKDTVVKQACFLPVSEKGALIGRIAGFSNLYIGTGNAVWGILNGPATGLALAELIVHGESRCVDLSRYNPMEK